jgi:hypothetical protein
VVDFEGRRAVASPRAASLGSGSSRGQEAIYLLRSDDPIFQLVPGSISRAFESEVEARFAKDVKRLLQTGICAVSRMRFASAPRPSSRTSRWSIAGIQRDGFS